MGERRKQGGGRRKREGAEVRGGGGEKIRREKKEEGEERTAEELLKKLTLHHHHLTPIKSYSRIRGTIHLQLPITRDHTCTSPCLAAPDSWGGQVEGLAD